MLKLFAILLTSSIILPAMASDPVWMKDRNDDRYQITVYHSPTCGCCKQWIQHLKAHNFEVNDVPTQDVNSHKQRLNVPTQAASCHTAEVNGVAIEGHVPAQDIKRVLTTSNDIRLLTVPAMPSGSPGMDTDNAPKHDFNVYAVDRQDKVSVFNSYKDY